MKCRAWIVGFALLALALWVAGCGGGTRQGGTAPPAAGGGAVTSFAPVAQFDLCIDPQQQTVKEVVANEQGQVIRTAADVSQTLRPEIEAIRWYPREKRSEVDIRLVNRSSDRTFYSPIKVVVERLYPASAQVLNPDGQMDGKPYWDYSGLLGDNRLDPGEHSGIKTWKFRSPLWGIVVLKVRVWAETAPPAPPPPLPAEVRVLPTSVSFEQPPEYVQLFIELPAGFDPALIRSETIRVGGCAQAEPGQLQIVDTDGDGIPEAEVIVAGWWFTRSLGPWLGGSQMACIVTGQTGPLEDPREFRGQAQVTLTNYPAAEYLACWPGPPKETVQNASYEDDADNDGIPDKWWYFDADVHGGGSDWNNGGFITPTWDNTVAHTGTYSAKITVANQCSAGPDNGYTQWVFVKAGDKRTVSAWFKVTGLTNGKATPGDRATMELHFYDKHGGELNTPDEATIDMLHAITMDTDWKQISTSEFTVPDNATVVQVNLMLIVNAQGGQNPVLTKGKIEAWIDDADVK